VADLTQENRTKDIYLTISALAGAAGPYHLAARKQQRAQAASRSLTKHCDAGG
jgi:D-serine dehydratase